MRARSAVHLCFRALEAVRLAGQLLSSSTLLDHLESTTALPLHPTSITCHLSTPQPLQNIEMSAKDYYGGQGGGTYLCLQLAEVGVYLGPGTSYRGSTSPWRRKCKEATHDVQTHPGSVSSLCRRSEHRHKPWRHMHSLHPAGGRLWLRGGCCSCCSHV